MNIDFDKTIFVIDSPLVAMIVAIIAGGRRVRCIYEFKVGVDNYKNLKSAFDIILLDTRAIEHASFFAPSPYFLFDKKSLCASIKKIFEFQKVVGAFSLDPEMMYCGPLTSSLMARIPKNRTITIDHGSAEYEARICAPDFKKKSRQFLKSFISKIGFYSLNRVSSDNGFTLCQILGDIYTHVDYREYRIPTPLTTLLQDIGEAAKKCKRVVLVNPISAWHDSAGFNGDTGLFDDLNIEMIERNCRKEDFVLIKFHPSVYYSKEIKTTLVGKLRDLGYSAADVDSAFPKHLQGLIPGEIIVKAIQVNKIVAELTALFFNVSHTGEIELVSWAQFVDGKLSRNGRVINHIERVNSGLVNKVVY